MLAHGDWHRTELGRAETTSAYVKFNYNMLTRGNFVYIQNGAFIYQRNNLLQYLPVSICIFL